MEIANIVASGDFDIELDLGSVALHAGLENYSGIDSIEHSRRQGNRLNIHFSDGSLGILSPNGVYIFTGVKSHDRLQENLGNLLHALQDSEVIPEAEPTNFQIRNYVIVEDLETGVDLNALSAKLGLNNVEYEPEQFPGLVYRPENTEAVLLIFATGKVVITGAKNEETASTAFFELRNMIKDTFR